MNKLITNQLLNLLNQVTKPEQLIERFGFAGESLINRKLAERILSVRNKLAQQQFRSVDEIVAIPGMTVEKLNSIYSVMSNTLLNDRPVLLFPVRLETRVLGNDLWIRIYPDQISFHTHEEQLTQVEIDAGLEYHEIIKQSLDQNREQTKQDAWRKLSQLFGPERAAWIAKTTENIGFEESFELRGEQEDLFLMPKLIALPDQFIAFAYRNTSLIHKVSGAKVRRSISLFAAPIIDQEKLFDSNSRWMVDLSQAEADGMAIRMRITDEDKLQGFSRIIVVGILNSTATTGQRYLEKLINGHHYSTGLSFLEYGTPTNNTQKTQSGYSESIEDREKSYNVEIVGPPRWGEPTVEPRTNAQRLGHAFGLGPNPEIFHYLEHSGNTSDSFAEEMHIALWPATGDYFLRYLLPGLVNQHDLGFLGNHFTKFVRGNGYLPAIRVGDQPYGILPVTSIRAKSMDNPCGWESSSLDKPKNSNPLAIFDMQFHSVLCRLFKKWFDWSQDPRRVPRINTTRDPDAELLQILAMEPSSISYRTRPFVDERFIAWLLVALRNYVFGADTPYYGLNSSPLYWIQKWSEVWYDLRHQQSQFWNKLTNAPVEKFENAPLMHLLAWWNDKNLEIDLVRHIVKREDENGEEPLQYLRNLCEQVEFEFQPQTLLRDLLERSLLLANNSCFSSTTVRKAICTMSSTTLLEFFNVVTDPEQIVRRIKDDPEFDVGPPRAYGVRRSLAERILERRNQLPESRFTAIDQIDEIFGVGEDTLHDIIYTFRDQEPKPDIDRHLRETLDLCTHRLDAWFSSFANKRLEAMRRSKPEGIYLGAYGWIENLNIKNNLAASDNSKGFIHAPSTSQAKAAAVLHNAYLTHADGKNANPLRINLNSDRVRFAMQIIEGIRQGQTLGALLGYQFERGLHEKKLDQYIDDFRAEFPIVANKETPPNPEDSIDAIAARNVVDGLALSKWWQNCERPPRTQIDRAISVTGVDNELDRLLNSLDAVSDLMLYEGVYQAVQGNFQRGGAAIDATSGKEHPQEIESILTPISGKMFKHRVCLLFPSTDVDFPDPRAKAEPRLAAWFSNLIGIDNLSQIGCSYDFKTERFNINEVSETELAFLPGLGPTTALNIVEHRKISGTFKTIDELDNVPAIDNEIVEMLRPWVMTGIESTNEEKYYERININTADINELIALPGIGTTKANAIIEGRPYLRIADLEKVSGIGLATIENIRRFITTGVTTVTVDELGLSAIDLLYLSSSLPVGEETEIEQRVAYFVREEYGLNYDVRINIDFSRSDAFTYGIREALELGQTILDTLPSGMSSLLQPDSLCLPVDADMVSFASQDIDDLQLRIETAKNDILGIIQILDKPIGDGTGDTRTSDRIIYALFDASRYGVSGSIPKGSRDPDLDNHLDILRKHTLSELQKRWNKCEKLLAIINETTELDKKISLHVDAMKALFGRSFIVLPTFVPYQVDTITQAFQQTDLLADMGDERIRLWLQQAAQTHPPLKQLEDALIETEVWQQSTISMRSSPLTLHVAQLPFDLANRWLALDDNERGLSINADITTDRGALSIVAVIAGDEVIPMPSNGTAPDDDVTSDNNKRVAGLLIDQWDEQIPSDKIDTSAGFQYDAPGAQAPQCLLLAVPGQYDKTAKTWQVEELVEIIKDTMDLAKIRTVDLDAMREIEGDAVSEPGIGSVLPGLMFPADAQNPGWARETFTKSIAEWIDALVELKPVTIHGVLQYPTLTTDDGESWILAAHPEFPANTHERGLDYVMLSKADIEVRGDANNITKTIHVKDYRVIRYPAGFSALNVTGKPTMVGSSFNPILLLKSNDGNSYALQGGLALEVGRVASSTVRIDGHLYPSDSSFASDYLWIDRYEIVDIGGGIPPTAVGTFFTSFEGYIIVDRASTEWELTGLSARTVKKLADYNGGKMWAYGAVTIDPPGTSTTSGPKKHIDVSRFGFLRAPNE